MGVFSFVTEGDVQGEQKSRSSWKAKHGRSPFTLGKATPSCCMKPIAQGLTFKELLEVSLG